MAEQVNAVISFSEPNWYSERKLGSYGGTDQTDFYAPLPVFFQGHESWPRPVVDTYEWDFGDGSDTFSGFNAMHVYEAPGTYTATLTVTSKAAVGETPTTDTATVTITVRARNGTTYYVDAVLGDDSNDGKSPGAGAWKTANKAFEGISESRYKPGDQILFERDQTFEFDSYGDKAVTINHWQAGYGYMFGARGTGARPLIKAVGSGGGAFFWWLGAGGAHITFQDLEFDCTPDGGTPVFWLFMPGLSHNILFHRMYWHDFEQCFVAQSTNTIHGVYFVECESENSLVTHFGIDGTNVAIMDCDFGLSNNHHVYGERLISAVVSGNVFNKAAFGRAALRVSGGEPAASNVWVSNNEFNGWIDPQSDNDAHNGGGTRYNFLLVEFGPNAGGAKYGEWLVFENNTITDCETFMNIAGWHQVIVRNNYFTTPSPEAYKMFHIGHQNNWVTRPNHDVKIIDNTFEYTGTVKPGASNLVMICVWPYTNDPYEGQTYHRAITIARNVFKTSDSRCKFLSIPESPSQYASISSDNNLIYCASDAVTMFAINDPIWPNRLSATYTLEDWQDTYGRDFATQIYTDFDKPVHGWVFSNIEATVAGGVPLDYRGVVATAHGATVDTVYLWYKQFGGTWAKTGLTASTESGSFLYMPPAVGTYHFATTVLDSEGNESLDPPEPGSTVVWASGVVPETRVVPNVLGMTQAAATSMLTASDLVVGGVSLEYSSLVAEGLVISQSAHGLVPVGTSVSLVVSLGVQANLVQVPPVTGMTQADAVTALTNAGLVLGTVTTQYSDTVDVGEVISQVPVSGVDVSAGSAVNLVVSLGVQANLVQVPPVTGMTQADAVTALTNAGLVLGTVTTQYSDTVDVGEVISQVPVSGVDVSAGSAVNLVVSLGEQVYTDWHGTGTEATTPELPNTLLEIRKRLITESGRYDLVADAANGDWTDNGANAFINDAQRWLDRQFGYPKEDRWFYCVVNAGETVVSFQHARIIKQVWVAYANEARIRMTKKPVSWLKRRYPQPDVSTIEKSLPVYWALPTIDLHPSQKDDTGTSLGVVDTDYLVYGHTDATRGIIILPPPDKGYTLAVLGAWHSAPLRSDDDRSVWTYEPHLLVMAARRMMEIGLRNTQGRKDFEEAILPELYTIERDLVAEEVTGDPQVFIQEG